SMFLHSSLVNTTFSPISKAATQRPFEHVRSPAHAVLSEQSATQILSSQWLLAPQSASAWHEDSHRLLTHCFNPVQSVSSRHSWHWPSWHTPLIAFPLASTRQSLSALHTPV